MAGDYAPRIEDDERYGKLREERRARRRLRRSPTRAARPQASEAPGDEQLTWSELQERAREIIVGERSRIDNDEHIDASAITAGTAIRPGSGHHAS